MVGIKSSINLLDIYDSNGIPTSVELQNHLDPYYPADAKGDFDADGLSNLFEYNNSLNMKDPDTDHDGINDGDELNYWNITRGLDMDTAISYCKIPDVDRDNITDGKEINGYKVKIITGWKSDGTPISETRFVFSDDLDPLIPYANSDHVYTDTNRDGIPDVVEVWFSNSSIATNYNYRMRFIHKFGYSLYSQYSWIPSYFWILYHKDYKNNHNSTSALQNATKYLRDQFNPLIVDHTPPLITKFKLWWDVQTTWTPPWISVKAVVHLIIHDVGKIKSLTIYDWDSGESYTLNELGNTSYDITHKFGVSVFTALVGSVKIGVYAKDYAGNSIYVEKELKGALQSVIDTLAKLWSAIWNTLVKVGKAIAKAVNFIVQWIINQFMNMFNTALKSAKSVISGFISTVIWDIDGIYKGNVSMTKLVMDIMTSQVFLIMLGFMVGLTVINYLIMATGIGGAILTAISGALLVALGITMVSIGISFVLNPSENVLKGWIESILDYVTGSSSTSHKSVRNYNLYADSSDEKLFEEISFFVLPLFWTISAFAAEDVALTAFAVGLDIVGISLGMVYLQMEEWHYDKNATINVTKGIIGALVGGIIATGIGMIIAIIKIKMLVAIFDAIVLSWGIIELLNFYSKYQNLTSGGGTHA